MKRKVIIILAIVVISALLFVGCTANTKAQDSSGYQYGKNNAQSETGDGCQENSALPNGNGSGNNQNGGQLPQLPQSTASAPAQSSGAAIDTSGYGSAGALSESNLSLENMLTYAIQDEYLAHAEYVYIIDAYGNEKPFSNIIKAEESHINQLLPLFSVYGISAPQDDGASHVASVGSLNEAYKAGEQAEINNIAMYDAFLKQELPDDVRTVFEELQKASENHLKAFRNHL
jgi:hypothetical protein